MSLVKREKDGSHRPITRLEVLQALDRGGISLELLIEKAKLFLNGEDLRIAQATWEKLIDLITGGKKGGPMVALNFDMRDAVSQGLKEIRQKAKQNFLDSDLPRMETERG